MTSFESRLQAKGDTQPDLLSNRQNAEGKVHEPEQKVAGDSHEQQGKGSESSNVKQEPKEQKQGQETSKTDGKQEPKASKADQKEQKASETEQKKPSQQKPKEEKPGSSTGAGTKESGSVKDTVAVPSQEKKATSAPVAKPPANLPLCPQQPPKLGQSLSCLIVVRWFSCLWNESLQKSNTNSVLLFWKGLAKDVLLLEGMLFNHSTFLTVIDPPLVGVLWYQG